MDNILRNAGISHQRTKTWKDSNDPVFELKNDKKAEILEYAGENDLELVVSAN